MPVHPAFRYARKVKQLDDRIKELQAKRDEYKGFIKQYMEEQGVTALEDDGVRISYVQNESISYSLDKLQEALPPKLIKRITVPVLDVGLLQAQVQAGNIEPETVSQASEVKLTSPYLRISLRG